jgi:hypothetical protein
MRGDVHGIRTTSDKAGVRKKSWIDPAIRTLGYIYMRPTRVIGCYVANPTHPENRSEAKRAEQPRVETSLTHPEVSADPPMWVSISSLILIALFIIATLFAWFFF